MSMMVIALVAASCSSATSDAGEVEIVYVQPLNAAAEERMITVHRPSTGSDHPVVVLLHGSGATRATPAVVDVAESLAANGVVVFVPDHGARGSPDQAVADRGRRLREGIEDAVCAVRYAADHADEVGGDSRRISIVGHSAGGLLAALVFLGGDEAIEAWSSADAEAVAGEQARCVSTAELPRLAGMVGYNPALFVFDRSGLSEANPELARLVDPRTLAASGRPGVIRFVVGGADTGQPDWHKDEVRAFAEELRSRGHDADAVTISRAEHDWATSGPVWEETLDIILAVA